MEVRDRAAIEGFAAYAAEQFAKDVVGICWCYFA
jgi:hypothetical protein